MFRELVEKWFAPDNTVLVPRWIWLRALGAIFFSAFFSLWFQIDGLIGPRGVLPAVSYLADVKTYIGPLKRFWFAPTLLWIGAGEPMLHAIVLIGAAASIALMLNLWPRMSIAVAAICFLSFVAAAQDFSGYQSDGMLLEAALLSIFFAPAGLRPSLGAATPPSRASLFMLRWEWFRIYFESGMVKIISGEQQWRNLTAMDKYYENGPLPTWIAWYAQQMPHSFHLFSAGLTLFVELFVAWLVFLPRPARMVALAVTTLMQIGIILTANYAFLNYLVLFLGVLLWSATAQPPLSTDEKRQLRHRTPKVVLPLLFVTTVGAFLMPNFPTVRLLEPFRVANSYGLFAIMTRNRYEIEFQGTPDGTTWIAYPFRYKPQDPMKPPRIFAPYQPRFEWNLWFASFAPVEQNVWVFNAEQRLLEGSPPVLRLFASNPFVSKPPLAVRAVLWRYRFTTRAERARSGAWWSRELLGQYAPAIARR